MDLKKTKCKNDANLNEVSLGEQRLFLLPIGVELFELSFRKKFGEKKCIEGHNQENMFLVKIRRHIGSEKLN